MIETSTSGKGFQEPVFIDNPTQCHFYHTTELPIFGVQTGYWDLRKDVDNYLGGQNLKGLTVLDVGTASGFIAFEMEKRGAHVIALDRDLGYAPPDEFGLVPFYDFSQRFGYSKAQAIEARKIFQQQLRNSFWLTHRLLSSAVRLYAANAYDALDIEPVDCAFFGCILLHLRDPLSALSSVAARTRQKIIVTDTYEDIGACKNSPVLFLRPNIQDAGNPGTWWYMTPGLLKQFLAVLGFAKFSVSMHQAWSVQAKKNEDFFTVVAER